jgi:hypothetical protein
MEELGMDKGDIFVAYTLPCINYGLASRIGRFPLKICTLNRFSVRVSAC